MFYHVKELQFNARVSKPDPAFATLLLEQFGGANGELAAALRYFGQAFGARKPYPDKYDLLMDITTEEVSLFYAQRYKIIPQRMLFCYPSA